MSSSTDRVPVGLVARAHGIRGEVSIRPDTDDPRRFDAGAVFATAAGRQLLVLSSRTHKGGVLVRFEGIDSRNEAETLIGSVLTITAEERRRLDDEEFWPDDLIGMKVQSPDGVSLGTVERVLLGDAQDRLEIRASSGDLAEVPFVDALVPVIDVENGVVVVEAISGLFSPPGD